MGWPSAIWNALPSTKDTWNALPSTKDVIETTGSALSTCASPGAKLIKPIVDGMPSYKDIRTTNKKAELANEGIKLLKGISQIDKVHEFIILTTVSIGGMLAVKTERLQVAFAGMLLGSTIALLSRKHEQRFLIGAVSGLVGLPLLMAVQGQAPPPPPEPAPTGKTTKQIKGTTRTAMKAIGMAGAVAAGGAATRALKMSELVAK